MNDPSPSPLPAYTDLRHPGWILVAGCLLAFLGAGINACFLLQFGTSVSHLTGDVSKVAMNLATPHTILASAAVNLCTATLGFLLGALFSGFFIHHPNFEFSRPYGRTVMSVGLCFLVSYVFFDSNPVLCIFAASAGCGTQNALATRYRGIVLRTTHITGLLTDLGTMLGMKLKGYDIAAWKISVPLLLAASFFCGAILGSLAFVAAGKGTLLCYAVAYMAGGLIVTVVKRLR